VRVHLSDALPVAAVRAAGWDRARHQLQCGPVGEREGTFCTSSIIYIIFRTKIEICFSISKFLQIAQDTPHRQVLAQTPHIGLPLQYGQARTS
jgi:hypothetical protein